MPRGPNRVRVRVKHRVWGHTPGAPARGGGAGGCTGSHRHSPCSATRPRSGRAAVDSNADLTRVRASAARAHASPWGKPGTAVRDRRRSGKRAADSWRDSGRRGRPAGRLPWHRRRVLPYSTTFPPPPSDRTVRPPAQGHPAGGRQSRDFTHTAASWLLSSGSGEFQGVYKACSPPPTPSQHTFPDQPERRLRAPRRSPWAPCVP